MVVPSDPITLLVWVVIFLVVILVILKVLDRI
jgi:hypothetical protein